MAHSQLAAQLGDSLSLPSFPVPYSFRMVKSFAAYLSLAFAPAAIHQHLVID